MASHVSRANQSRPRVRSEIRQLAHQQRHVVHPSEAKYYVLNWPRYVSKHGGSWSWYLRVMMVQDARTLAGGERRARRPQTATFMRCVWGYRLPPLLADARTMYPVLAHRPRSHHLAPVPVSSCTRYLAAPRGMRPAWGMGRRVGRGAGRQAFPSKREHGAPVSAQSLTAWVTPREREHSIVAGVRCSSSGGSGSGQRPAAQEAQQPAEKGQVAEK